MNRRDFNTALAALVASPIMPMPAVAAPASGASSGMTYLFADLIARSRGHVDAGFLARRLNLGPDAAQTLMQQLTANRVIHAPVAGVAHAINPIATKTAAVTRTHQAKALIRKHLDQVTQPDPTPADIDEDNQTENLPDPND